MTSLSCTNLITMGRHIPTPFSLSLEENQGNSDLKIESIIRLVPGRRMVALAQWQDRQVIVKLFFHATNWKRNMLRDLKGINLLRQAKIPTPNVLLQTTVAGNNGGVLIINYLKEATSLAKLFDEASKDDDRDKVMNLAIKAVALCHQAGLWQKDIHLDNFMLARGVVYVLDGADIRAEDAPLPGKTSLQNLALFFAQFIPAADENLEKFLSKYKEQSGVLNEIDSSEFEATVIRVRRGRVARYERKLFRSTSANRSEAGANFFTVYDRSIHSESLEKFISDPSSFINPEKLLKQGNTSTVALVEIDERMFVLKRYNIKGFWHGISRMFRPSRAHHSWRNALVLEMLGVATPKPFLFLEERLLWVFRRRAYFLCEYIDAEDLGKQWGRTETSQRGSEESGEQAVAESDSEVNNSSNIIEAGEIVGLFRRLFKIMSDYRISHGDMKATNFIVSNNKLYVLDLDAMRRHESRSESSRKIRTDLARFRKNWLGGSLESAVESMSKEIESLQAP